MAAADLDEAEWELCNDDGFVFKRKKRRLADPRTAAPPPPPPDPLVEEKQWKQRRRRTLLKLRNKYQSEIRQWELLSNRLTAMEVSALQEQQQRQRRRGEEEGGENQPGSSPTSQSGASPSSSGRPQERACRSLVDELLLQAEAQDAVISDVSNLCDIVETMCDEHEGRSAQSFIDLPIWGSPQELMLSLCDE